MKTLRNLGLTLCAACLFVALSAISSFANGGGQGQADEHAGYQGIPVRNGLNRGAIAQADSSAEQRYPRLPRRPNESNIAQTDSVDSYQGQYDSRRAGYRGIPQSTSNRDDVRRDESPNMNETERAGYSGIPQGIAMSPEQPQRSSAFLAHHASALVNPK